jgi:starvation-inducible outer membrane lipoprotein
MLIMKKPLFALMAVSMALALHSCDKPPVNVDGEDEMQAQDVSVLAEQSKYYMTADEDLEGKISKLTSGMKVILSDSKF